MDLDDHAFMSFVTRCPSCSTLFKVVADQLKISQGWVRCGYCSQVFDATVHLQTSPEVSLPEAAVEFNNAAENIAVEPNKTRPSGFLSREDAVFSASPVDGDMSPFDGEPGFIEHVVAAPLHESYLPTTRPMLNADLDCVPGVRDPFDAAQPMPEVSFVLAAKRHAFWRAPLVRFSLGLSALLLLLALALQVAFEQRDWLAAAQPQLTSWLNKLCVPLRCTIKPLQRIEAVVIDSSSFNTVGHDAYLLTFTVKNTNSLRVAMPSLELTLLDPQEKPMLRRVFTPQQLGATSATLDAGAEFSNALTLKLSTGARAAGYRMWAFYP